MVATTGLGKRIEGVRTEIARAAERVGRDPATVTLVAVSKTVDRAVVDQAYDLGLRHFGENRVRDAQTKYAAPLPADAALHLIGQLQTNKARPAVGLFDLIESVDRPSLVDTLASEGVRIGEVLPVLIQVNVAREEQKAGCPPEDAPSLLARAAASSHLTVVGLMTIAPLVEDADDVRSVFRGLRELRDALQDEVGLGLPVLSMGMSNDFGVAIEEGATHVRIGRAIFG